MTLAEERREELRRPPCWGPNEKGDLMVDMEVEAYEHDLDRLVGAARVDLADERARIALAIEDSFQRWLELGDARPPFPVHSGPWIVQMVFEQCAAIARGEPWGDE